MLVLIALFFESERQRGRRHRQHFITRSISTMKTGIILAAMTLMVTTWMLFKCRKCPFSTTGARPTATS